MVRKTALSTASSLTDLGEKKVDVKKWAARFEGTKSTPRYTPTTLATVHHSVSESSESESSEEEVIIVEKKQRKKKKENMPQEEDIYATPKKLMQHVPHPVTTPHAPPPPPPNGTTTLKKSDSSASYESGTTEGSSDTPIGTTRHNSRSPLHRMEFRGEIHHFYQIPD
jgi:hypothetical protein